MKFRKIIFIAILFTGILLFPCLTFANQQFDETNKDIQLEIAILSNNISKVKHLLENGANPNRIDSFGDPILFKAVSNSQICGTEIVRLLLKAGADPNTIHPKYHFHILYLALNKDEVLKLLLEYGSDPNYKHENDYTLLMFSSLLGQIDNTKKLLKIGADVNIVDKTGYTALMYSCIINGDRTEIVKLLLAYGTDKSIVNNQGKTALDITISNENEELINLLK